MKYDDEAQSARKNRIVGLLFLFAGGAFCWFKSPAQIADSQRGVASLVQNMGWSEGGQVRLLLYCAVLIVLAGMGLYQVITGRRVGRWGD